MDIIKIKSATIRDGEACAYSTTCLLALQSAELAAEVLGIDFALLDEVTADIDQNRAAEGAYSVAA